MIMEVLEKVVVVEEEEEEEEQEEENRVLVFDLQIRSKTVQVPSLALLKFSGK